jgi:hypothetical protein
VIGLLVTEERVIVYCTYMVSVEGIAMIQDAMLDINPHEKSTYYQPNLYSKTDRYI